MRLDFNVLWVDDQPDGVATQRRAIGVKMIDEGFEFIPRLCTTIEQVDDAINSDNVFTDEIDLILVDWDLGNDIHGEDVIERIREIVPYKDVVFYSGAPTSELRRKVFDKELEGVYCVSREGLVDEVIGVFDSLIKKVLDLDHTRGIVMGATSDIDDMVKKCLTLAHNKLDEAGKAAFIELAVRRVAEKVRGFAKKSEKLKDSPDLEALFEAHMIFQSDDRLRMLSRILGKAEFAPYSGGVETVKSYREGVVRNRNILGHAVLVPQGKARTVMNEAGREVGINEMRELRKLILSLRAEFRALLDAMQA
jgi:hypothetical protein